MHEMQRSALYIERARHGARRCAHSVARVRSLVLSIVFVLAATGACVHSETPPVKPLRAPRQVSDIVGIWRTVHQNVLELRQKGTYVLITSVSDAQAGDFTLDGDRITVSGMIRCGGSSGTYRIQVAYQQKLVLSDPQDTCAFRRTQLTVDEYVYSNPES